MVIAEVLPSSILYCYTFAETPLSTATNLLTIVICFHNTFRDVLQHGPPICKRKTAELRE